ncbi:MAG TPA: NUDIX domain-containing protein [Pyrinomonadaceae bacterium]|nr:NUDIX domain-containing protein [Pyrinomonadaceae bacterium]
MSTFETKEQVSAGGVVYRRRGGKLEAALISVGEQGRWQLPKGLVGRGESPVEAALREVREETGLTCEVVAELERVEYWYFSKGGARRVRFHKFVHFYLMRHVSGDVSGHDDEVNEARWVALEDAGGMLAFRGERKALEEAREMLAAGAGG